MEDALFCVAGKARQSEEEKETPETALGANEQAVEARQGPKPPIHRQ